MSRHQCLTLGGLPPPRASADFLADRIVAIIAAGVERFRIYPAEPLEWRRRPGAMPWWELRQRVGGRVTTDTFAESIESLLDEGRVIEVWLARPDKRDAPHLLVLPGRFQVLPREVAQIRGRSDVLEGEPWAQPILARPMHA